MIERSCVTCKFFIPSMGNVWISSPSACKNQAVKDSLDPIGCRVNGKSILAASLKRARADDGPCGKDGIYWEAKELPAIESKTHATWDEVERLFDMHQHRESNET